MNIIDAIRKLLSFLHSMRRSGTTSLLKKISSENDIYVIFPTTAEAKDFGSNGISIMQISDGLVKKPVLMDNHTLLMLLEEAGNKISNQEYKLKEANNLIWDIEELIRSKKNIIKPD